jgi:hypothetical protein
MIFVSGFSTRCTFAALPRMLDLSAVTAFLAFCAIVRPIVLLVALSSAGTAFASRPLMIANQAAQPHVRSFTMLPFAFILQEHPRRM